MKIGRNSDLCSLPRSTPTNFTYKGRPRRDSEPTSKSRYTSRDTFSRDLFMAGHRLSRQLSSSLTSLSSKRSRDGGKGTPRPQRTHKRDSSLPVPLPVFTRSRHNSNSKNQSPLTFPHPVFGPSNEPVKYLITSPTRGGCNTVGPVRQRTRRISSATGVTSIECRSEVYTPELFDDLDSESDEINQRRRTRHFSSPIMDSD